jgi:hypothetical protein
MDQSQIEFENWLHATWDWLQHAISEDAARFKVRSRPTFTNFVVVPSNNPELYPPELRTKLAIARNGQDINDVTVTAQIECGGTKVDPTQVWSGSYMTPIFKLSYYKSGDDFGLNLTVLKAEYEPSTMHQISNDAWMIDSNTSGSESVDVESG